MIICNDAICPNRGTVAIYPCPVCQPQTVTGVGTVKPCRELSTDELLAELRRRLTNKESD